MKKKLKFIVGFVLVVLLGIQFIPIQHNSVNSISPSDFVEMYKPPLKISEIIQTSCYDCHSNQTKYPWYSKIQPIGLILQNHILEGKSELNFSEFGDLSKRMKRTKLKSMISQIEDDKMPLLSYTFLHKDAILSQPTKVLISNYLDSLKKNLNQP